VGDQGRTGASIDIDEDREDVRLAAGGDTEAFARLVRRYQQRVVHFARGVLAAGVDAEDVAQEAFLRAYQGLRRFRGASTFKTWLYQIVLNVARTEATRRQTRALREGGDRDLVERAAGAHDFERALVARDRVAAALATLPPELREAVVLRDVEGFEYREMADMLGVPIGTVESRIFRGRLRLRAALVEGSRPAEDISGKERANDH
jgi:RNA polymerase sigma-70 factor (ECF subfamily)